jgi:hypothetical protein
MAGGPREQRAVRSTGRTATDAMIKTGAPGVAGSRDTAGGSSTAPPPITALKTSQMVQVLPSW